MKAQSLRHLIVVRAALDTGDVQVGGAAEDCLDQGVAEAGRRARHPSPSTRDDERGALHSVVPLVGGGRLVLLAESR